MRFVFFTYDGAIMSVARKLLLEGYEVRVCQIRNASSLGVSSWINDSEAMECRKRRLSIYDGFIEKHSIESTLSFLKYQKNKDDFFIVFDYNNQYKISEAVLKMGYQHGLFPMEYDYLMEKDRKMAKDFLRQHYNGVKLKETKEFKKVDDVIKFVQESDKLWVIKSDGNFAETLVPDKDDLEMGRNQVISELEENRKDFEKGKIMAEEKIMNPIEFTPQMVFYNGEPIYSQIEIETRMFGPLDIGPQTGGNENLIIRTELSSPINNIIFPDVVYKEAKKRKGIYIRDAGILSDGQDLYFTEFAGCRWGWGGIFSELSASMDEKGNIGGYFESLKEGMSPYNFDVGVSLALYTLDADNKFVGLPQGDIPMTISDHQNDFFLYQIKRNPNKDAMINIGYRWFSSAPLGYVVGRGHTVEEAVSYLYNSLHYFSLKGIYYRPKSDFLSKENEKCVLNRLQFLIDKKLIYERL
jgi:hypothetical protein